MPGPEIKHFFVCFMWNDDLKPVTTELNVQRAPYGQRTVDRGAQSVEYYREAMLEVQHLNQNYNQQHRQKRTASYYH